MQETEKIWMNGELVDWADAKVHVGATGSTTDPGCSRGSAATRRRTGRRSSAFTTTFSGSRTRPRVLYMDLPYSVDELRTPRTS